ncbi:MAG: ABC transporter ATP-binding protein [Gammaproteobacteria bacterium]|nr:ABC transporter ATP-binding protein [Gammaproteobacteria bacterium]MYD80665.1 ABC transporter ATP-binding protein [Gammaproteobacteria bacterium]
MVIRLDKVGKSFKDGNTDRWIFQDLSFTINDGDVIAISGPSGCGKTTLMNMLAGLLPIDSGSIEIQFEDRPSFQLKHLNRSELLEYRRSDVGYVYQFFNLVPTLTLKENVLLPIELTGRKHLTDQALSRIESLGLESRTNAFPEEMSGGEQQRAAIARALAHGPRVLYADEPTGNLDAKNSSLVVDMLWQEVASAETTLVIASHSEAIQERAKKLIHL